MVYNFNLRDFTRHKTHIRNYFGHIHDFYAKSSSIILSINKNKTRQIIQSLLLAYSKSK